VCLSASPGPPAGPGRRLSLVFNRGPGPDFAERDRDLATVLRPHLHQAYLDAERRRRPAPQLTARHWDLLHLVAAGTPTPRSPAAWASPRQPCARTWNTSTRLLGVSSRAASVTRVFTGPDDLTPDPRPGQPPAACPWKWPEPSGRRPGLPLHSRT